MLYPSKKQLSVLSFKERSLFRTAFFLNRYFGLLLDTKRFLLRLYSLYVTKKNVDVQGFAHIAQISNAQKVVLISNHRSFIDMYLICASLIKYTKIPRKCFFPVRSNFFYDSVSGFILNLFVSGLSMFPPFFRLGKKRSFNSYSLSMLADMFLNNKSRVLLGYHPEGGRNKSVDPYSFLKVQPGVGEVLMRLPSDVIVIPVFLYIRRGASDLGRSQNKLKSVRPKYGVCFGSSIDLAGFRSRNKNHALYLEVSGYCMDAVKKIAYAHRDASADIQA